MRRIVCAVAASLTVALAPACARQGTPTGGPPDVLPPVVVATRPDTFAEVAAIDEPLRIEFSERISERPTGGGSLDEAVIVSPRTGEVRVDHARDALEVELSGGFRPGLVYTVTVLPVVLDLFSNALREPFSFAFSTGGELVPTAAAGMVLDRTTGQPVRRATVMARPVAGDTTAPFVTVTDSSGIWALRYLPVGEYEVVAFEDRDRDFVVDSFEVQGARRVAVTDTVLADIVVLQPDTSAARLARVEIVDSVSLRLEFDDFLEPEAPATEVGVAIVPDTTAPADAPPAPAVSRVVHAAEWEAWRDSLAAAADTAAPDTAAVEGEEAGEGQGGRLGGRSEGREARTSLIDAPLPSRELYVRLDGALPPDVPYVVRVSGVVNLVGLGGGGGSRVVTREPPPERDTTGAMPDSARLAIPGFRGRQDTTQVRDTTDTMVAPPDTTGASPDTTAPPPTAEPPDTTVAPADTTRTADTSAPDSMAAPPDTMPAVPSSPAPPDNPRAPRRRRRLAAVTRGSPPVP